MHPDKRRSPGFLFGLALFLIWCALLVGWSHLPARSSESPAVWAPAIKYDSGTLTRPQNLGWFPTLEACKDWVQSDEGKAELQAVAESYKRITGEDPESAACLDKTPGDPA